MSGDRGDGGFRGGDRVQSPHMVGVGLVTGVAPGGHVYCRFPDGAYACPPGELGACLAAAPEADARLGAAPPGAWFLWWDPVARRVRPLVVTRAPPGDDGAATHVLTFDAATGEGVRLPAGLPMDVFASPAARW